ncbi:hypothetical protein EDM56_00855 [Brevibacillus fluminis]|uniref:Uncharacterized protein n=1 Tax=Brevibacillus fluminis TaxID=511487 RepID=A0A3M8DYH4_9BACL|nr:hypothetical protein EDM56_00855 [Brevibacillus fluminis]
MKGFSEKSGTEALAMPARRSGKRETSFASHIIVEIHPPRSVWLWGAVSLFPRSRSFPPSAGIVRASVELFSENPLASTKA